MKLLNIAIFVKYHKRTLTVESITSSRFKMCNIPSQLRQDEFNGFHSCDVVSKYVCIFTASKRSVGQGNVFRSVCHSVQGGLCPGGSLSRGVSVQEESLSRGVSVQGVSVGRPPRNQKSGRYAPHWNAFCVASKFIRYVQTSTRVLQHNTQ